MSSRSRPPSPFPISRIVTVVALGVAVMGLLATVSRTGRADSRVGYTILQEMEEARRRIAALADGVRYFEDHTVRYMLFNRSQEYQQARVQAQRYREAHARFLGLELKDFIVERAPLDDYRRLTRWGLENGIAQVDELRPRRYVVASERVLFVPGYPGE